MPKWAQKAGAYTKGTALMTSNITYIYISVDRTFLFKLKSDRKDKMKLRRPGTTAWLQRSKTHSMAILKNLYRLKCWNLQYCFVVMRIHFLRLLWNWFGWFALKSYILHSPHHVAFIPSPWTFIFLFPWDDQEIFDIKTTRHLQRYANVCVKVFWLINTLVMDRSVSQLPTVNRRCRTQTGTDARRPVLMVL